MSQPPQGPNPPQQPSGQSQQPYGQPRQPYGQPPYSYPSQPPYGGQPSTSGWSQQPQPGAPSQPPYPGTPGQQPYGYPTYYQVPVTAAPKRGAGLGITGFVLVLLGGAVGVWGSWTVGSAMGEMFVRLGIPLTQLESFDPTILPDAELAALSIAAMPALVASLVGIVGWVLCIVATVRGSARPLAIIGIVLGVMAPVAEYFALVAGMVAGLGLAMS